MNKFKQLKEAIKNTPPERLAAIEYRSHAFHILGVLIVSVILTLKGFWYILFAFVFTLGVSYSQMVGAFQKWEVIKKFNPENLPEVTEDPSPTRRRTRIIKDQFGKVIYWMALVSSFVFAYGFINFTTQPWYGQLAYVLLSIFIFVILYYFIIFYFANAMYKRNNKAERRI